MFLAMDKVLGWEFQRTQQLKSPEHIKLSSLCWKSQVKSARNLLAFNYKIFKHFKVHIAALWGFQRCLSEVVCLGIFGNPIRSHSASLYAYIPLKPDSAYCDTLQCVWKQQHKEQALSEWLMLRECVEYKPNPKCKGSYVTDI